MQVLRLEPIWHTVSTELLDRALRSSAIRHLALKQGEKQLYHNFFVENKDDRPTRVQELRYLALRNLLYSIDRALADGRISPQVRRAVIKNFIGQVVMGESERQRPFKEKHGYGPPSFLVISPTKTCNLRCIGCYAASSAKNNETISYSVLQRIMRDKREEWGSHFTVISGGEPLMYKSEGKTLFDWLEANLDNYFMMYTNGTLITREVAKRFAELGNVTPAISVEGWEEQTDYRRGKGVFKKILKAMENLREEGVPFGISVTATRQNAEIVLSEEFMDFFFNKQGAIYGWIFQYMPIGRSYTIDLMVTPEQRRWMLEQELKMIYDMKLFLVDFWNGGPMSVGCISAGRSGGYFYIDWDGNIAPCVFFPYYVDNIYKIYERGGTLSDALESPFFKAIRKWQDAYGYRRPASEVKNYFLPCPIRDHYKFAYRAIERFETKPLDEFAKQAIGDMEYRKRLLDYDKRLKELLDPVWEREVLEYEKSKKAARAA